MRKPVDKDTITVHKDGQILEIIGQKHLGEVIRRLVPVLMEDQTTCQTNQIVLVGLPKSMEFQAFIKNVQQGNNGKRKTFYSKKATTTEASAVMNGVIL